MMTPMWERSRLVDPYRLRTVVDERSDYLAMKDKVTDQLKRTFRPEFLNRIDEIVVFHALNKVHITQIADIMLKETQAAAW